MQPQCFTEVEKALKFSRENKDHLLSTIKLFKLFVQFNLL